MSRERENAHALVLVRCGYLAIKRERESSACVCEALVRVVCLAAAAYSID